MDYQIENRRLLDELIEIEKRIDNLKKEIKRLQLERNVTKNIPFLPKKEVIEEIKENPNTFQDELKYYIYNYRSLPINFQEQDLLMILPSRKHLKYREILLKLAFESFKEIREAESLRELSTSIEEREICDEAIGYENRKMNIIRKELTEKEEVIDESQKNNIILVPTTNNKIRILDELEHIPMEFYDRFLELVNSIIDGTFKNVKALTNNGNLMGISEVKGYQVRILFTRIGYNSYALISAFVKKTDSDKYYLESLDNKAREYYLVEEKLKMSLQDEEFIRKNNENVNILFDILSTKSYKLGEVL